MDVFIDDFLFPEAKKQKEVLRRLGVISGIALLGFILLQEVIGLFLQIFGLYAIICKSDETLNQAVNLIISLIAIIVPYYFASKKIKIVTDIDLCPLSKPKSFADSLLAVPAGVMFCLLGSYAVSYFVMFLEHFGIKLTTPDLSSPTDGFALFIYIIRLTVAAAVTEEFAMRGITMQPLRKYGNKFAIVMSSLIFAIMHRNLIQAPFAFAAGIAIGYFTIKTGSMWTGILIHLCNNGISALSEYYIATGQEDKGIVVTNILIYGIIGLGIICMVLFSKRNKGTKIDDGCKALPYTNGELAKAFFLNVPMVLAIILLFVYTSLFISIDL